MIYDRICSITENENLGGGIYLLTLRSGEGFPEFLPGQFVQLRISEETSPTLRRPFSIYRQSDDRREIDILYKVVGSGTELLSRFHKGDLIKSLGPLGNSFPQKTGPGPVWLAGGGIGMPPVAFAGRLLQKHGSETVLFYGGRSSIDLILLNELRNDFASLILSTEDGSAGTKGFITHAMNEQLKNDSPQAIYACGPMLMLKAITSIGRDISVPVLVSMETYMGCGFGVCNGCAVPVTNAEKKYLLVCKDGPVFDADTILWSSDEFA